MYRDKQVIKMTGNKVDKVESFEYLESVLQKRGGFEKYMTHWIKYGCGWSGEKYKVVYVIREFYW